MLKLSVEIELEGYGGSKMAAAAALRVAFLSSAVGGSIRGWTINEITLIDKATRLSMRFERRRTALPLTSTTPRRGCNEVPAVDQYPSRRARRPMRDAELPAR